MGGMLYLIPKHLAGSATERQHALALTDEDHAAMAAWWHRYPTTAEADRATDVFRRMRHGALWLGCDCQGTQAAMPLMSVVRRDDELFLRRMPDRPAHAAPCPYYREHTARGNAAISLQQLREGLRERPATAPTFYELEAAAALPDSDPDERSRAPAVRAHRTPLPSMARRMFWLLDRAAANTIPQSRDILSRMITVARDVAVGASTLDRFMFFSPAAYESGFHVRVAANCRDLGIGEHAYLMAPVIAQRHEESGDVSVVQYKGATVEVPHAGTVRAYGSDEITFPKLGLFQIDAAGHAVSGYLHPIYKAEYWIPVDSDLERRALGWLWKTMIDLSSRIPEGLQVVITKPIYEEPGDGALPDLRIDVIDDASGEVVRRMAIEILGFTDPQYRARKSAQAEALRQRYQNYFALDGAAATVDWQGFAGAVKAFVRGAELSPCATLYPSKSTRTPSRSTNTRLNTRQISKKRVRDQHHAEVKDVS